MIYKLCEAYGFHLKHKFGVVASFSLNNESPNCP